MLRLVVALLLAGLLMPWPAEPELTPLQSAAWQEAVSAMAAGDCPEGPLFGFHGIAVGRVGADCILGGSARAAAWYGSAVLDGEGLLLVEPGPLTVEATLKGLT